MVLAVVVLRPMTVLACVTRFLAQAKPLIFSLPRILARSPSATSRNYGDTVLFFGKEYCGPGISAEFWRLEILMYVHGMKGRSVGGDLIAD